MLKLVWIPTVLMCLGDYHLFGSYQTYIIDHGKEVTYFKLQCPQNERKLTTEKKPDGITIIKEFPNASTPKNTSK